LLGLGCLFLANGATIITVLFSALKLSSDFGKMQEKVNNNSSRIKINESRIHEIERARAR